MYSGPRPSLQEGEGTGRAEDRPGQDTTKDKGWLRCVSAREIRLLTKPTKNTDNG